MAQFWYGGIFLRRRLAMPGVQPDENLSLPKLFTLVIHHLLLMYPDAAVVTGVMILVICISLMGVGINWAGGGLPTLPRGVDGVPGAFPNPGYGQLQGRAIALCVLVAILPLIRWGSGFVANVAVLLGIVAGAIIATLLGVMHFEKVVSAPWIDVVAPL